MDLQEQLQPVLEAAVKLQELAEPRPFDLSEVDLPSYRSLRRRWQDWGAVSGLCGRVAMTVLDRLSEAPR